MLVLFILFFSLILHESIFVLKFLLDKAAKDTNNNNQDCVPSQNIESQSSTILVETSITTEKQSYADKTTDNVNVNHLILKDNLNSNFY